MDTNQEAEALITKYAKVIKWAVNNVVFTFQPNVAYDEAVQQARILLMSYAGIMPGWHYGSLASIEAGAKPEGLLATQLRLGLCHYFGTQLKKVKPTYPLSEILEKEADPLDEYLEDRIIERVDAERDIYSRYPYLTMHVLEDLSLGDIAGIMDVSESTVDRRIADEKYRFVSAMIDKREALKAAR